MRSQRPRGPVWVLLALALTACASIERHCTPTASVDMDAYAHNARQALQDSPPMVGLSCED